MLQHTGILSFLPTVWGTGIPFEAFLFLALRAPGGGVGGTQARRLPSPARRCLRGGCALGSKAPDCCCRQSIRLAEGL